MNLPNIIAIYAEDWNQYIIQHNPKTGEAYSVANGWVMGGLIEETEKHLVIASTIFDSGDVRGVVVIPKCCILKRVDMVEKEKP